MAIIQSTGQCKVVLFAFTEHQPIQTYGEMRTWLHAFLITLPHAPVALPPRKVSYHRSTRVSSADTCCPSLHGPCDAPHYFTPQTEGSTISRVFITIYNLYLEVNSEKTKYMSVSRKKAGKSTA
jgi:hypothetical protein